MDYPYDNEDEEEDAYPNTKATLSVSGTAKDSSALDMESINAGKDMLRSFLKSKTMYDVMPKASRVVVFDMNISLRAIFGGLVENQIRSAPVWSPDEQRLVGVITLGDFADLYLHSFITGDVLKATTLIDSHSFRSWRQLLSKQPNSSTTMMGREVALSMAKERLSNHATTSSLFALSPTTSLFDACVSLKSNKVHRMPVIDSASQTMLHMASFQTLLDYVVGHYISSERNSFLEESIYTLGVGSFVEPMCSQAILKSTQPRAPVDLVTASPDIKLSALCELFSKHRVSCIPIVDPKTNRVRDLFCHTYLASLKWSSTSSSSSDNSAATTTTTNWFEKTVREVIDQHANVGGWWEPVHTCTPLDTLSTVFTLFHETKARMLIVVDPVNAKFCGLVTLADLFGFFA